MSTTTLARLNTQGMRAIYLFEMARFRRTLWQSLITPVITTALYFLVFGGAIGSRVGTIDGVSYAAFIVPGLIMLTILTESLSNAAFGIYMPKFTGTIYELHSAPVSALEAVFSFVGAAATKSVIIALVILATSSLFVPLQFAHPLWMAVYLVLVAFAFCLGGFIIGVWARSFDELQMVPMLIVMPMTFLGGAFYSIDMLPGLWRTITLFNPIVYVISGFRWTFYDTADVPMAASLGVLVGFLTICLILITWIFRTGYRLKR